MKKILNTTHLALLISGFFIGSALFATASVDDVAFPIAELGGCEDRGACYAYCEEEAHMSECIDFAQKHGLISEKEAKIAREYPEIVSQGGPGGCGSMESCESYCIDIAHIGECVAFAETHGLIEGDELKEAKQIAQALEAGATMPGGCVDKRRCNAYCEDTSHMEECLNFATAAGMMSEEEIAEAQAMMPFITKGEMPGQCTTKRECEDYCGMDENFEECVSFAEKAGLVSEKEAEIARKTGGKGPGGCEGTMECESYCNDEEHQRECFDFAKEHDLISEEELAQIEEGVGRLRAGLEQAPDGVRECLYQELGETVVQEIETGEVLPDPDMGKKMEVCFAGFVEEMQQKLEDALAEASSETVACVEEKVGEDNIAKIRAGEAPSPETGSAIRECFEKEHSEGMQRLVEGLETMPDEARECVEEKLGVTLDEVRQGNTEGIGPEAQDYIQKCMEDLVDVVMKEIEAQAPQEVTACLREKYENGLKERILTGDIRGPEDIKPEIEECAALIMPAAAEMGSSGEKQTGAPPADFQPDASMCKQFERAPSCDYVPDEVKEMCRQCRGE